MEFTLNSVDTKITIIIWHSTRYDLQNIKLLQKKIVLSLDISIEQCFDYFV